MRTKAKTAMTRRFVKKVLASLAVVTAMSATGAANAQELQLTGPLKGAPAVRHLRLYRQGRFEIAPAVSFSLLDEYRRTILAGARLNYNITDWLAIGVWGAAGVASLSTDLSDKIDAIAPRDQFTAVNVNHSKNPVGQVSASDKASFEDQTAKISYVISPQATFIPFRGKLAIFNKIFVDTDLYIAGGVAFVGIQERADCGGSGEVKCSAPSSFELASQTKIAPTFGIGLTFYPSNFVSLGVEYRALPFSWNRSGFDSRGSGPNGNFPDQQVNSDDETFKFNQFVTIALGFSFPTKPKISE
jgi:opacity protein-like surface antigen